MVRQEAVEDRHSWNRFRFYGIDMVHVEFFDTFICKNLLPFAEEFRLRTRRMADVLLRGGEVNGVDLVDLGYRPSEAGEVMGSQPAIGDNSVMQTDPPKAEPPKRKRRWFQFSLRTL